MASRARVHARCGREIGRGRRIEEWWARVFPVAALQYL
jgi:hypothetical protein